MSTIEYTPLDPAVRPNLIPVPTLAPAVPETLTPSSEIITDVAPLKTAIIGRHDGVPVFEVSRVEPAKSASCVIAELMPRPRQLNRAVSQG